MIDGDGRVIWPVPIPPVRRYMQWNGHAALRCCTSLRFLDACQPNIAAIFRYWNDKRGQRRMPARRDLDPVDLKPYLPSIMLVDVYQPLRLTYRLVGTREAEARGYDPTGKAVESHFVGDSWPFVKSKYSYVVEHGSFLYDEDQAPSSAHRLREAGAIFLPLSEDDTQVNMICVYTDYFLP